MKKKSIALTLGIVLALSPCTAYAENNTAAAEAAAEQQTETGRLIGQVVSVDESSITVTTGSLKQPGGMGGPGSDMNGQPGGMSGQPGDMNGQPGGGRNGQAGLEEMPEGQAPADDGQTPPALPEGQAPADNGQTPPELPEGQNEPGNMQQPSDGEMGQAPDMDISSLVELTEEVLTISITADTEIDENVTAGTFVTIEMDETGSAVSVSELSVKDVMGGHGNAMGGPRGDMNGQPGGMGGPGSDMGGQPGSGMGGPGGPGGQSSAVDSYDSVNDYTEDASLEGETISSTGSDENAVLVENGASVTLSNVAIDRTSSDSTGGDSASFYGVGAAALATDGTLTISDSTITTDSAGGTGVFAYGDGTVYVSDTTIATEQNTSGGIHAAGGGTLYAWDCDVTTQGGSAAAIRSDRGGGTMVVDGGSYTSNGVGSPAVYCTADITAHNAQLEAAGSEAVCIEGLNTLRLYDCSLTGNMSDDSQNDCTWTVIVYQSMSGDSEIGNGTFEMKGGTLTSENGGLFYTTNTECTITLDNVEIIPSDTNSFFLQCTGNTNQRGWGQTGSNGSDCLFTAISQQMEGDVIWDTISTLDFYVTGGSTLTGAVINDETWAGNGGEGWCNLVIDDTSSWVVTGDSTLTSLSSAGSVTDMEGNIVTIVGTDGTEYVTGDSPYTITVGSYSETADLSGAQSSGNWENYEVSRSEQA